MRRFLLGMAILTFLLIGVSTEGAWQVNIKNTCNKSVWIDVYGEHLFSKPTDCRVLVKNGTTQTCVMPEGICPLEIRGTYYAGGSYHNLDHVNCGSGVACCWNVNVEVAQWDLDSCLLKILK